MSGEVDRIACILASDTVGTFGAWAASRMTGLPKSSSFRDVLVIEIPWKAIRMSAIARLVLQRLYCLTRNSRGDGIWETLAEKPAFTVISSPVEPTEVSLDSTEM